MKQSIVKHTSCSCRVSAGLMLSEALQRPESLTRYCRSSEFNTRHHRGNIEGTLVSLADDRDAVVNTLPMHSPLCVILNYIRSN